MSRTDKPNNLEDAAASPAFFLQKEGSTVDDYQLIVRVGEGSFGEVWKASKGGFPVALKILRASMNSEETQRELKSLETLKKLHHKFLLHTERFWSHGDRLFIEMELADGGTLKERLVACQDTGKKGIPEDELLKYFTETAKALDYLHTQRPLILHRDIKPANILLVQGCAKLADFGLLRQVAGDNSATHTQGGTFPYMGPESILENVFSVYTDLWAFAVTYVQLRQGELPFPGLGQYQICEKVVKAPPELSDIFDPEEKKVLLKALDKDPRKRFTSCGEFVFELNRVVPWVPAVDVPGLTGRVDTERRVSLFSNTSTTDPHSPKLTDPGTTRKKTPATMQDIELPETAAFAPNAPTVSRDEGTVINEKSNRSTKPPAEPPAKQSVPERPAKSSPVAPAPATVSKTKQIQPVPVFTPARPKPPTRGLLALVLFAGLIGILSGLWFFVHSGAKADVRDLIAKDRFPEALQTINETSRLWLPSPEPLRKEVEEKWWAELAKKDAKLACSVLEQRKKELAAFEKQFPQYSEIKAFRQYLDKRAAECPDSPEGKPNEFLAKAEAELKEGLFDECYRDLGEAQKLASTESEKQAIRSRYHDLRDRLVNEVRDELRVRKNYALAMTKLSRLAKFKSYSELEWPQDTLDHLEADESLASAFQKQTSRAFELYEKLLKKGKRNLLDEHTIYFLNGIPDRQDIINRVTIIGLGNVTYKELRLLVQLAKAHEPEKGKQIEAVGELITLLNDNELSLDVRKNLWLALARLEDKTQAFRFEDLDALETAFPTSPDQEQVKQANSQILASVLERKVKMSKYEWLPSKAEMGKLLPWFERIDTPKDGVLALKAECLVELDSPLTKISEIRFPLKADWYGSYVHALVLDKTAVASNTKKKHMEAAVELTNAFKGKAELLKPRERSASAVRMLRTAVGTLEREGKNSKKFVNNEDAKKAIDWLTLVFDLLEQKQDAKSVNDLIDLAFAAVKLADTKYLKTVSDRLDNGKFTGPEKASGFYWLAKAYVAEGKSESEVFIRFNKALEVTAPENDALRKLIANEAADFALQLAKADVAKSMWKQAIEHSILCQNFSYKLKNMDLNAASQLNGDAVEVHALAVLQSAEEATKWADACKVYDQAIQKEKKAKDGFIVSLVVAKLEFAKDQAKFFPNDLAYLAKAVEEGEDAIQLALAEEKTAKLAKDWWQTVRCKGMVRLADMRGNLLRVREGKIDKEVLKKPEVRQELKKILDLYEGARALKKYTERWNGELSSGIGTACFLLGFPGGDTDMLTKARQELTQGLAKAKANPAQPYSKAIQDEVQAARMGIEGTLTLIRSILDK